MLHCTLSGSTHTAMLQNPTGFRYKEKEKMLEKRTKSADERIPYNDDSLAAKDAELNAVRVERETLDGDTRHDAEDAAQIGYTEV